MAELDRIRWRCRRGLLELDLVLERFQREHLEKMSPGELAAFSRLLDSADNDLWDWVGARGEPADPLLAELVQRLRSVRITA
jgi:antitoxin CptB